MQLPTIVNLVLSSLTIVGQVGVIVLIIILVAGKRQHPIWGKPFRLIEDHTLLFGFIVALTAMLGSLTYSDILGYEPCKLCWLQRICMYPEVLLFGLALYKKDRNILPYALMLAAIGEFIALYHYIIQLGLLPAPCTVSGYSVSCAQKFVLQFGYITIPVMAFTAFVMIIFITVYGKKQK